jgi:hypothetical protein
VIHISSFMAEQSFKVWHHIVIYDQGNIKKEFQLQ